MSEVESSHNLPAHFDEVVEIAAQEQRERQDDLIQAKIKGTQEEITKAMQELTGGEENPFWQRFLQPNAYYDGDLNTDITPVIEQVLNGEKSLEETKLMDVAKPQKSAAELEAERKRAKEMEKIRRLDK